MFPDHEGATREGERRQAVLVGTVKWHGYILKTYFNDYTTLDKDYFATQAPLQLGGRLGKEAKYPDCWDSSALGLVIDGTRRAVGLGGAWRDSVGMAMSSMTGGPRRHSGTSSASSSS